MQVQRNTACFLSFKEGHTYHNQMHAPAKVKSEFSECACQQSALCFSERARQVKEQIPGDRKECAMKGKKFRRKCHQMVILSQFVCALTVLCQGISIPRTLAAFSSNKNKFPHDYRLTRTNTMSKRVEPVQAHASSQKL
eukprot:1149000-Pelagomonas_calceolata.AAC.3